MSIGRFPTIPEMIARNNRAVRRRRLARRLRPAIVALIGLAVAFLIATTLTHAAGLAISAQLTDTYPPAATGG